MPLELLFWSDSFFFSGWLQYVWDGLANNIFWDAVSFALVSLGLNREVGVKYHHFWDLACKSDVGAERRGLMEEVGSGGKGGRGRGGGVLLVVLASCIEFERNSSVVVYSEPSPRLAFCML